MKLSPRSALFAVIVLTLVAGFFVYPLGPLSEKRPWQLGLDLVGGSHLVFEVDLSGVESSDASFVLEGLRDRIERRANPNGVSEPQVFIARTGDKANLVVEIAGVEAQEAVKRIGETPLLDFREVFENGSSSVQFLLTQLTGAYVTSAQLDIEPVTRKYSVAIAFDAEGAKLFEDLTEKNVGKPLAIFLDGAPISVPIVQQKITGGKAVITGNFSRTEARELVARFKDGALPAPIKLINQQSISPTLGLDSFRRALFSGAVGTFLVIVFMIIFYGAFGIFSSIALLVYIVLTLAVFKAIPVTMTLAGLAGFILTIGMAVDANVLIFERTKEEIKRGLSRTSAVEEGFRRAWPSIRDSNVSTIITAVILFYFTSSFIRGFALTLLIGVLVSMFSALTVTRTFLLNYMGRRERKRV